MKFIEVLTVTDEHGLQFEDSVPMDERLEIIARRGTRELYASNVTDTPYDITPPQLTTTDRWLLYPHSENLRVEQRIVRTDPVSGLRREERGFEFYVNAASKMPFPIYSYGNSSTLRPFGLIGYRQNHDGNADSPSSPSPSSEKELVFT